MWVLKIKLKDKNCIWATRCKEFGIYSYQYPLGFYTKKGKLVLVMYHIFEGKPESIKNYIKSFKKDRRVKRIETGKNTAISVVVENRTKKELEAFKALYNPRLIYIKPGINFPDGTEIWEIGSFDRRDLIKLQQLVEKYYEGQILLFRQIKSPNIFIPQIMPELTEKQKEAFKIASEKGYYEFPRRTNLHKLASLKKISRPTFEEHLRKAEIKLLGFMKELS